jgi:hypothetical protein
MAFGGRPTIRVLLGVGLFVAACAALNVIPLSWGIARAGTGPGVTPTLAPTQVAFTLDPSATATVLSNNGQVVLVAPPGSLVGNPNASVTVSISPQSTTTVDGALQAVAFGLEVDVNGAAQTQFAPPLQLTIAYDPNVLATLGITPASLHVFLQASDGTTTELATTVDSANNVVTAEIPHLSTVSVAGYTTNVEIPVVWDYLPANHGTVAHR